MAKLIAEGSREELVDLIKLLVFKSKTLSKRLKEVRETLKVTKALNERTLADQEAGLQDLLQEKVLQSKNQLKHEYMKQLDSISEVFRTQSKLLHEPQRAPPSTASTHQIKAFNAHLPSQERHSLREPAPKHFPQQSAICSRCKAYIDLTTTLDAKLSKLST